jgi:hypothetical protein
MTERASSHCSNASRGALGQGLPALGLRLRLSRELTLGFVACCHGTGGQLLLGSSVNV